MVADGGLPEQLRRAAGRSCARSTRSPARVASRSHVKNLATRLGLTDRHVTHRDVKLRDPAADRRLARVPDASAATPPTGRCASRRCFGCFDIRWNKDDSAGLFDAHAPGRRRAGRGRRSEVVLRARRRPARQVHHRPPARRLPDVRRSRRAASSTTAARVHGYDGLYVLDGSIVPTALGVNPSKTIAALAERGVEHLLAERGP